MEGWPLVSELSSEHDVRWDEISGRVIKTTKEIYYGEIPVLDGAEVQSRAATVIEYLHRTQWQIEVFHCDIRWEGVFIPEDSLFFEDPAEAPKIVTSQPWYRIKEHATAGQIEEYLEEAGFEKIPRSFFGWLRRSDGVVIQDATPDNFIFTEVGLAPIDLQMSRFTPEEMRRLRM